VSPSLSLSVKVVNSFHFCILDVSEREKDERLV